MATLTGSSPVSCQQAMEGAASVDLRAKYARLAAEYSKIRSHLSILKKGIFDEQAKSADLKELLRDRELSLRKSELEIDSLNFRNQQLTKRITVLQDDVESFQSKNARKGKHKKDEHRNPATTLEPSNDSVIQEELQKKIIENAKLISQMADKEFELSQLSTRMIDNENHLTEMEAKFKSDILKLKMQNQELINSLESAMNNKEKSNLPNHGTPSKNFILSTNQMTTINGDFSSDVGSLIGSEDALSAEESLLNEQLRKKSEILMNTEQENQSLKIECDLLKLEIESYKSNAAESIATYTKEPSTDNTKPLDSDLVEGTTEELLGKLISPFSLHHEILERENKLKNYFREKISTLVGDRQQFESMTKNYLDENDGLRMQIEFLKKEQNDLEEGLKGTQTTISKLEDELHSTGTNYEHQIILLTEHVGNLNDILAKQFEEIQQLKECSSMKK